MAHVEFDWVARKPFTAEHPLGTGTIVSYQPGDRVPANDWGQAAHHLEANDKIMRIAINVSDPGDGIVEEHASGNAGDGLSDPNRQYLAFEGRQPLADEEPSLEPDDDEDDETGGDPGVFPQHQGNGVYELSDGTTVRGKRRAEAAEEALAGG